MAKRATARDAYDAAIIRRATLFVAVLFQPRGESLRLEFDTLAEAIGAAGRLNDEFGRHGLCYAISPEGREAQIPRERWPIPLQPKPPRR